MGSSLVQTMDSLLSDVVAVRAGSLSLLEKLDGKHEGEDLFGKASNANIYIMGINQVEFGSQGIKNEWVLFDETMIWKQILLKTG